MRLRITMYVQWSTSAPHACPESFARDRDTQQDHAPSIVSHESQGPKFNVELDTNAVEKLDTNVVDWLNTNAVEKLDINVVD
ncbi:hypothetical protein RRG08_043760 [Elysia crispata]|uniref:Uncharacterized protein n=1 Tax=Elysia crispata TaxID=231223 RepID=A0AAE1DJX1_9GAST|nr:hypothetical protein RRG08_043760 [Elysia crispata]